MVRCRARFFGFVLIALYVASLSETLLAQSKRPLAPADLTRLRSVVSVVPSPDGRYVAYVVSVPRRPFKDPDGPAWTELHVYDVANRESRPYVSGQTNVSNVAWTPDGKHISFLSKRSGDRNAALYVIAVSGGEAIRVLEHKTGIREYTWSPDGKQVAFAATEPLPEHVAQLRAKGFNQEIYEEDRPFVRVWVARIEDWKATSVKMLDLRGSASSLAWSPVGPVLAICLAPTPLIDDHYMRRRIHFVHADNGKVLARVDNPGKLGQLAWSPDGRWLAFISAAHLNDPAAGRLMVADPTDGSFRVVVGEFEGHVSGIAWEDNRTLRFLADEGVWTTVSRISLDGGPREVLLGPGGPVFTSMHVADHGRVTVFRGERPDHPGEVYIWRDGQARPERVTNVNPWLSDIRLARQEVIRYRARDGLELEAILIRPLDWKRGQRYPLLVTVHGGPESHIRNGWVTRYAYPGQIAAARGFAVVYPNYRASTGRGVEFSMLDHGDPAGKEFDDLVDCVDHLIDTGLVDPSKVAVTGGSYGGYATAWCCTYYSDRFAAGVMFVGISDKISKAGTTDIPDEIYLVHDRHRLWEAWQLFLERSPIYYVTRARTPLLILHGKNDTRVHPSQSMELYRHLKTLGKTPVRLVFYPGEGHGNRRAASRFDYILRAMRWLEHFVVEGRKDLPPAELDYEAALKILDR